MNRLTLRQEYAKAAMQGFAASGDDPLDLANMASTAFAWADAMCAFEGIEHERETLAEIGANGGEPRYPWHDAPPTANYAATDADGQRNWYESMPLISLSESPLFPSQWVIGSDGGEYWTMAGGRVIPAGTDWRDTLEPRPENTR